MDKHISSRFEDDLKNLQNMVIEMGKLTEQQLAIVQDYLRGESSEDALGQVVHMDVKVNQYHIDINKECVRLTATRNPVASDLRFLSASDRMAIDFERIGDETRKIARFLLSDDVDGQGKLWQEVRSTTRLAADILSRTINALVRLDAQEAYALLKDDKELDANFKSVVRQLVTYMIEDPRTITQAVDVLFAAKAMERIGDHAINIAEAIIFHRDGTDIRHDNRRDA